jgi:iron(III) transport system ATP-binding protein
MATRPIPCRPKKRNIGLVFQSYALWPHKTVAENLAFPLIVRKIGRAERDERIKDALGLVEMLPYADRYPFELSGGQQQRVALARALVYRPPLLLLDEPLSNLDAKLRERARVWLRELQERLSVTTIYVTHDQAEALAVSDRIAVMSMGRMRQLGTPGRSMSTQSDSFSSLTS